MSGRRTFGEGLNADDLIEKERQGERARCVAIIQAEIERARALLNLEDADGQVFDGAQMEAGIAALEYVIKLIQEAK